ncbi:MAG: primosomal protein N' [Capsulimonadaceae bacterium]
MRGRRETPLDKHGRRYNHGVLEPPQFARYASVVVQVDVRGLEQPFTYGVPAGMTLSVGDAVMVPFGNQTAAGHVIATTERLPPAAFGARIKPVASRIAHAAAFNEELLDLARWVAGETFTELRDTIRLIAPEILESRIRTVLRLVPDWRERLAGTRTRLLWSVAGAIEAIGPGGATLSDIARALAAGSRAEHPASRKRPAVDPKGATLPESSAPPSTLALWDNGEGADRAPVDVTGAELTQAVTDLRRRGLVTQEDEVSPPRARPKLVRVVRLAVDAVEARKEAERLERRAPRQAALLKALLSAEPADAGLSDRSDESVGGIATGVPVVPMAGLAVAAGAHAAARALSDKGLISYFEVPVQRNPFRMFGDTIEGPPLLTDAQAVAAAKIGAHVDARDGAAVLLHGVTGSGKTEVYLNAVARTLAKGRSALVLIPEIGLTAQLLDLFKGRFSDDLVAVLHSALMPGERHDEWQRIRTGQARVVLGARSAAFAPLVDLGLIILDEEHDGSFKQESPPRYHARAVARKRAAMTGAPLVLGSATPALETFYYAQTGTYELVSMLERIENRPLPPVEIVDLRVEFGRKRSGAAEPKAGPPEPSPRLETSNPTSTEKSEGTPDSAARNVFSRRLAEALAQRLDAGEQSIVFLNRRGFATFLLCRDCGHTPHCPNCDVTLTYHHAQFLLQCHHCDHQRRAPDVCPMCSGRRIGRFGLGTEKVEEGLAQLFPQARLLRMDRDTMAKKGAHADALRGFRRGDADILIGTQMVAKGLDFPNVTLVGVVSADTALNVPDFRSAERAFQLLTQVAGRAGRGTLPGEVIVQTFNPEHPAIQRALFHDYLGFYEEELPHRRELSYPPFSHMANLVVSHPEEQHAQAGIEYAATVLRASTAELDSPVGMLGPVACPLSRLKNKFRWHLVLRSRQRTDLLALLTHAFRSLSASDRTGLSVDIDPLTML